MQERFAALRNGLRPGKEDSLGSSLRKASLQNVITGMDQVTLYFLSSLLVRGNNAGILREAMLRAVDGLSRDELSCWEEAVSTGASNVDFLDMTPDTQLNDFQGLSMSSSCRPHAEVDHIHYLMTGSLLSDIGVPDAASSTEFEWLGSFRQIEDVTNKACNEYNEIGEQHHDGRHDEVELQDDSLKGELKDEAADIDLITQASTSLRWLDDIDLITQAHRRATQARHLSDVRLLHNSQKRHLSDQQELRIKDFGISQLKRQLDFERVRDTWLASERSWRECRERQMDCWSRDFDGTVQTDNVVHGSTVRSGFQKVNDFWGEDLRVEASYIRNSCSFWSCEANTMDELRFDMEQKSVMDKVALDDKDCAEYDKRLRVVLGGLQEAFEEMRWESDQHQNETVEELRDHHGKVRKRHLDIISTVSHGDDDGDSVEVVSCAASEDRNHQASIQNHSVDAKSSGVDAKS